MLKKAMKAMHDETRMLHAAAPARHFSGLSTPVVRASTVTFPTVNAFLARQSQFYDGYTYALYGHPVTRELEARLCALAHGTHSLVVPSGLAAIALTLLAILQGGGHVLIPDCAYGPARSICSGFLPSLGIRATFYDPLAGGNISDLITPETRLIWVESPGSLTMEMQDLRAIVSEAQRRGCLVAVDNSWGSSLLHKPLALGADIMVEALSKHIGGHSDLILGAVTTRDERLYRTLKDTARSLGYGASPDDAWLALRGLESLAPRMRQQGESALRIALGLKAHPAVARVLYPALSDDPGHSLWRRDFSGASGVLSVLLHRIPHRSFCTAIESLKLFRIGASFGGSHSLVAPSDPTSARTVTPWSAPGHLVRLSIGLEHADDLIEDLGRALDIVTSEMNDGQSPSGTTS